MGKKNRARLLRMNPAEEYRPRLGAFGEGERVDLALEDSGLEFGLFKRIEEET